MPTTVEIGPSEKPSSHSTESLDYPGRFNPGASTLLTDAGIIGQADGVVLGAADVVASGMLDLSAAQRVWGLFATSVDV